jgi:uncharacterized protein (TIGR03905 family)
MFQYNTHGVCSKSIYFEVEGNKVKNVTYLGGCNGNLKGIGALVEGMDVDTVIARLEGTTCGMKATSCPDQLARALKAAKAQL